MLKSNLFIFKFLIKMVNQICAFLFVGIHTLEIEGIEKWNDLYAFEAICDTPILPTTSLLNYV